MQPQLKPIVDGFMLNLGYRPLCTQFQTLALQNPQHEAIRRSNTLRPYWACAPDDPYITIPAYSSSEYLCMVPSGSWLWGYIVGVPVGTTNYAVMATESCSGLKLFSEHALAKGLSSPNDISFCGVTLLPKPICILDPGVTVEISNISDDDGTGFQVLLMFAVPKDEYCNG